MDGTLGSRTARLLDGSGVRDHVLARRSRRSSAAPARAGFPLAVHAIGDRANRDALDAFEATRDAGRPRAAPRIEHAQFVAPEDVAALRRARRRRLGAVHPRHRRTATWPSASGPTTRRARLRLPLAAADAGAVSPTAPTRRSRSSTRSPGCAPPSPARSTTARPGAPSRRSPPSARFAPSRSAPRGCARRAPARPPGPGFDADLVVLTATRSAARPRSWPACGSWRPWSEASGPTRVRSPEPGYAPPGYLSCASPTASSR